MSQEKHVITRKIQLLIDSDNKEIKNAVWETLRLWRFICFKAANLIVSQFHLQEQLKDMLYLVDGIKVKLANMVQDEAGILNTSSLNTTYQVLSRNFKGEIPMAILSALNTDIRARLGHERIAVLKGEKSLRNYKRTIPIPFPATSFANINRSDNRKYYTFSLHGLNFRTFFGKDFGDNRITWEKALEGEYKLCTSSVVFDKGKIFLLAVYQFSTDPAYLKKEIVAEISLSVEIPMIVTIGKARYEIGNKEEFLHRRLAIQQARRRCQMGSKFNKSQHGRKRKLSATINYSDKEKNYINTKFHSYSRAAINLCIKHGAATLVLVNQTVKEGTAKEDQFLLRNWSYYNLKQKIEYKASLAGITVIVE
ncbi:hypothetical protein [Chitinophaga sp. Ak27]|uniref:hypothetical protein n=1 Tax=Chitinophaga sp. Ak27 TaxID=2726116 RepID=UPI00145D1437|nr:hypothetical protein [Chitinophaga sp. Ak27]NLU91358.1 hypothetical protein [Chitinophaga sp. Ak27]